MNFHDILYLLFVQVSLLLPGYVAIRKWGVLTKHPGIELSFGYLITIVFFAALAFADYVLRLSPGVSRLVCWAVLLAAAIEFLRAGYFKHLLKLRFPLICLLLLPILSLAFVGLSFNSKYTYLPDPSSMPNRNYSVQTVKVLNIAQTNADDNYIPYRQAQFFVNRSDPAKDSFISEWGVSFFQRTPLMGAVTANYFNMLHDKPPIDFTWSATAADPDHTYAKFQIISSVLNSLFIVPGFLILVKFFNRKTAIIGCLFMVTSQFFLYNAFFSWPKSLVAFFILLSWLLLLEKKMRYTVLAGVASGAAYLTHDLATLYIGTSVLLLLYNKRFRETFVLGASSLALALPWLVTASLIYSKPSSFIYYPISTQGIPQPQQSKQIIHQFLHTSPLKLLVIRLESLWYLISPYQLFTSEGGQAFFRRLWGLGLFSIPGSLGIGLLVPAFLGIFKNPRDVSFWILAITPVMLSVIIIGWPRGLGAMHFAESVIVLLSGLAVFYLLRLNNRRWLYLAFAANCLQLVFFVTYSYKFVIGVWFTHPADMLRLLVMASIVIFCGWAIYKTASGEKTWITS